MIIWMLAIIFKLLMDTILKQNVGPQTVHFTICLMYFLTFYTDIRLRFGIIIARYCGKLIGKPPTNFGGYFSVLFIPMPFL